MNLEVGKVEPMKIAHVFDLKCQEQQEQIHLVGDQQNGSLVDIAQIGVVDFVHYVYFYQENWKHYVELKIEHEVSICLQDVVDYYNLVESDQQEYVNGCLYILRFTDLVVEFLLYVLLVELKQVLGSLDQVVNLVLGRVLNYYSVVEVQIVVEPEHVHQIVVYLVGLVRLVVLVFKLVDVLVLVLVYHSPVSVKVAIGILTAFVVAATVLAVG